MKIKNFLATLLIFFIFTISNANATIPIANTYKQGIYKISESSKENYTAKLITPNNITSLIIIVSVKKLTDRKCNPALLKLA
ncbi:hypothetical protein [Clostridium beijerinckii]|uniref:hypothetical protein n=1 Tax=Clostridium beijerinckii TaxID=1520 RepID=UPI0022E535C9|nr:hypothetical protein [Clostridium beijerinckii]